MRKYSILLLFVISVCTMIFVIGCGANTAQDAENVSVDADISWQEQYDLGMRYLEEGNYEEAIVAFTKAIEIDAKQAAIYVDRGNAYILSGETEENLALALSDFEMAVSLDDTLAEAYLGLADVYIRQGNYENALEILKTGLEKTGNKDIEKKIAEMESGNITDSQNRNRVCLRYDESGAVVCREEFTYDAKRLTSVASYNGAGEQLSYVDILYDEQGRRIQSYMESRRDYESIFLKVTYEIGLNGLETKESQFDENGELETVFTHEYDENGKVIKANIYRNHGSLGLQLDEYWLMEYDYKGNPEKMSTYNADDTLDGYQTYGYDDNDNMIRRDQYFADGTPLAYENWEYDTNGNCIKKNKWHCDLGFSYYDYEYDEDGKLIHMKYKDDEGIEYVEEY